ncbi:MAG: tetratricopeptide repeat protein [Phycisphaerales bacterium]|nr:MAG: tetratricopeptide repeat protein [Phycisphaerales bacterium]
MSEIVLKLDRRRLKLLWDSIAESRELKEKDFAAFAEWAKTYLGILDRGNAPDELLKLGQQIYRWLDDDQSWLERIKESTVAPLVLEFTTRPRPDEQERTFLQVPWELLADEASHWATRSDLQFVSVRRLGPRKDPRAPSGYRLCTVFVAATPRQERKLAFEAEETAILSATGTIEMDLIVEESGTLEQLEDTLAFEGNVDVIHLSCHGTAEPEPTLALEDELGSSKSTGVEDLSRRLSVHRPQLLFVSVCETAGPDRLLNSLSSSLIQHGIPAVLGWAGPVRDGAATLFAKGLYNRLSRGETLRQAAGGARLDLLAAEQERKLSPSSCGNWHLARLYLGSEGGGVLSKSRLARRRDVEIIPKVFLDQKNHQVPVAGLHEFVGRRRPIQTILRAFREGEHSGAYIHGLGGQGKSSLAARIAQRMSNYETIVLHGRYDAGTILDALGSTSGRKELQDAVAAARRQVEDKPERLGAILQDLLENHFKDWVPDDKGVTVRQPVLLVFDDFEQCLEERPDGPHRVAPELVPAVRGVLLAFRNADTRSRLLFTSRHAFSLNEDGKNLADDLLDVQLRPMETYESKKQAGAKQRARKVTAEPSRTERVIRSGLGNPGLQDLLFSMALENPERCDEVLTELEQFIDAGEPPDEAELPEFLTNLVVERLIGLLSAGERELLRVSTVFELPVPLTVFEPVCPATGLGQAREAVERLLGLGLWDLHEDIVEAGAAAVAAHPLVRPLSGSLGEQEQRVVLDSVLTRLYEAWGGDDGERRPRAADFELARLAAIAPQPDIFRNITDSAPQWLQNRTEFRKGAAPGRREVEVLDGSGQSVSSDLLPTTGELREEADRVEVARDYFQRAIEVLETARQQGEEVDPEELGATLIAQGHRLAQEGRPDEAMMLHGEELSICEQLDDARARAVTLGDIARILVDKGQMDEAMKLHEQELAFYEQLGDTRSRAVTLGDIARILADKGQVDEAMKLHKEELGIYEQVGDTRSRAVTLGDIARILVDKGQVDEAMKLHQEMLGIFEQLGDTRSRAVTLGDIARILVSKGQVDEAMKLHQERLAVYEQLGDTRSRAVTLGDIARILASKGQVDEAMNLHEERLAVYEQLGDTRERAVTLGDIACILVDEGDVDEAMKIHKEELGIYEQLGDTRSRAVTLGDIARILVDKGQMDEAMELHQEMLGIFEQLGDTRSRAVTLGDIACILVDKGQMDEAMKLHEEELGIYEQLDDTRSRAATLGDIARILASKGQADEAMKLHEERLAVYEQLGDTRSHAVTLGDIARTLVSKGQVDEAMKLHKERLAVYERLGDVDTKAVTLWDMAEIEMQKEDWESASKHLTESYEINVELGRLDGICFVGSDLGQLLCASGKTDEGLEILRRSRDGFKQLGWPDEAQQVQDLLDRIEQQQADKGQSNEQS